MTQTHILTLTSMLVSYLTNLATSKYGCVSGASALMSFCHGTKSHISQVTDINTCFL
jgi:hypothetical protein